MLLRSKWFWALAFGALFVLSIDLWAWDWTEPSLFGLPYLVVYIILLEAVMFVMFWAFAKYYWVEKEADGT